MLHFSPPSNPPRLDAYDERRSRDQRYDHKLEDICLSGAQWRMGVDELPNQLGQSGLKPVARGWLEFIQRSIISTSNHSEVTVNRAIMIHYINDWA
ncbi:hypothetical protein AHAS_Ahas12G0049600 [Arachis hypogaea]